MASLDPQSPQALSPTYSDGSYEFVPTSCIETTVAQQLGVTILPVQPRLSWSAYLQKRSPTWAFSVLSRLGIVDDTRDRGFLYSLEEHLAGPSRDLDALVTDPAQIHAQIEETFQANAGSVAPVSVSEAESLPCMRQFQNDHLGRRMAALVIMNLQGECTVFKHEEANEDSFKRKLIAIKELCGDDQAALVLLQNCLCQYTLIRTYGDVMGPLNMWRASLDLEAGQSTSLEEHNRRITVAPRIDDRSRILGFYVTSSVDIDLSAQEGDSRRTFASTHVTASFNVELRGDSIRVSNFTRTISPLTATDEEVTIVV